jgi:peptidoglycan/LPS O-acetylase OafA/YrhL
MRLGYRPALDGLRGIAIALVVAFHAFGWPRGGTLGVDLFFVLSGFLITSLLLEEHGTTGRIDVRSFYVRRARRLLPALAVLLASFLLVGIMAAAAGSFQPRIFVGIGAAVTYSSNIVVAASPSAVPAGLVHLWSLAAEEQFYLAWPLVLVLLLRVGSVRLVIKALVALTALAVVYRVQLVMRGASIGRVYYAPDTHADSLLIGCLFACWFVRGGPAQAILLSRARTRSTVGGAALCLVIATALLFTQMPWRTAYELLIIPTGFALAAGILIASAVTGGSLLAQALSVRPLVALGGISYSLYLWHLPVLVALAGTSRHFDLRTVTAVALAVLAAAVSRRLVEAPFLSRRAGVHRTKAVADGRRRADVTAPAAAAN